MLIKNGHHKLGRESPKSPENVLSGDIQRATEQSVKVDRKLVNIKTCT